MSNPACEIVNWTDGTAFRKARVLPFTAVIHGTTQTFAFYPISQPVRQAINVVTLGEVW